MTPALLPRATAILLHPRAEWPVIAAEPTSVAALYVRYIMPLAALGPAVLVLRGLSLWALVLAAFQYLVQLAGLLVCAHAIAWVAPRFRATGDSLLALKLVAYASTPSWLAAVFNVAPRLGTVVILVAAVYAVYLYYSGLSPVMQTPSEQIVPFMLVSAMLVVAVLAIFSAFIGALLGGTMGLASLTAA